MGMQHMVMRGREVPRVIVDVVGLTAHDIAIEDPDQDMHVFKHSGPDCDEQEEDAMATEIADFCSLITVYECLQHFGPDILQHDLVQPASSGLAKI